MDALRMNQENRQVFEATWEATVKCGEHKNKLKSLFKSPITVQLKHDSNVLTMKVIGKCTEPKVIQLDGSPKEIGERGLQWRINGKTYTAETTSTDQRNTWMDLLRQACPIQPPFNVKHVFWYEENPSPFSEEENRLIQAHGITREEVLMNPETIQNCLKLMLRGQYALPPQEIIDPQKSIEYSKNYQISKCALLYWSLETFLEWKNGLFPKELAFLICGFYYRLLPFNYFENPTTRFKQDTVNYHPYIPCQRKDEQRGITVVVSRISNVFNLSKKKIDTIIENLQIRKNFVGHQHFMEIYEAILHEEDVWVISESMSSTLTDILEEFEYFKMKPAEIAYVTKELLTALNYLHKSGYVHGMLTSDYIHFTKEGQLKICDELFSFNKDLKDIYWTRQDLQRYMGFTPQPSRYNIVGTPYWISPEQISGKPASFKSDIWTVGISLWEMIEGEPPFMEFPPVRALFLLSTKGVPGHKNTISEDLCDFEKLCLTLEEASRPETNTLLKHPFLTTACDARQIQILLERTHESKLKNYQFTY